MHNDINILNKKELNSFQLIFNIYKFLSKKRRLQILFNLFLTFLSSILEIVSIAIILPFFTLLTNPKDLENYRLISPFLNTMETQLISSKITDFPQPFWQALDTAYSLVSPLKGR